jgi:hypothetical protein
MYGPWLGENWDFRREFSKLGNCEKIAADSTLSVFVLSSEVMNRPLLVVITNPQPIQTLRVLQELGVFARGKS